ncbi:interleukin-7 receptor subunit alpha isoform X2 [Ascaphus truei]
MTRKKDEFCITGINIVQTFDICLTALGKKNCRSYKARDVVQSPTPLNLTITYHKPGKEFQIAFQVPFKKNDYLEDKLVYQIALRKERDEWPGCENDTVSNQCKTTKNTDMQILEREFEPGTKYDAKVRAKPNGNYFKGQWSTWSPTVHFETSSMQLQQNEGASTGPFIPLTVVGCLVCLFVITLIIIFWKSRIKPLVWPEILDPKSTLEQLCKKPKEGLHINFNPDHYENIQINTVDDIKVKESTEDVFNPPPADAAEFQKSETGENILEKNMPFATGHMNSLPAVTHGVFSSWDSHNVQHSDPSDHMTANGLNTHAVFANQDRISNAATLPCGFISCNPPNGTSTLISCSRLENSLAMYSNTVKQTNNGIKALCREEAYITMSAFKTPSIAVKWV